MPGRRRLPRPGRVPEKAVQAQVISTYLQVGAAVMVLGTVRPRAVLCPVCGAPPARVDFSTRQTAGLADLEVWLPARRGRAARLLKHEVKADGGRLSPDQVVYQRHCEAAGVPYVVGGVTEALAWLLAEGYVTEAQVPHHRLSQAVTR